MWREQALKVVLVLVGLLFTAAIYPMTQILWYRAQPKYETAMGLAVYATLGIMLLMALRSPSAHRSLITFAAWSSFAHASVMATMVVRDPRPRGEWSPAVILVVIGIALLVLAPARESEDEQPHPSGNLMQNLRALSQLRRRRTAG